jgi:hypothetical protein
MLVSAGSITPAQNLESAKEPSPKNKNAGLVCPAQSLFIHLWGATSSAFPADLFNKTS